MRAPIKQEAGNSLELVDIKDVRDNAVVMKDGSLRQIIMVGGVNFSLKSEAEQNMMTQAYQDFLNAIDFPLQIVVHSRKVNVSAYLETLIKRKETEPTPLLQSQISEYVEFIKGFVEKNAIMEKSFLVVVPFYPTGALAIAPKAAATGFLPFLNKKKGSDEEKKTDEEVERAFKESLVQLGQRTNQVAAGIENIGLEVSVLESEELVELFYNFYNPQTVEREKINLLEEGREGPKQLL
ncbi:MAG: hypothetical protein KGJ13_04925 [Patescibacteria group bacterium]|nr:hypothetical protein [Patescibacteria group bacterium]